MTFLNYKENEFFNSVEYYKKQIKKSKVKRIFIYGKVSWASFFSLAPLTMAASECSSDMCIMLTHNDSTPAILSGVWETYNSYKRKEKTKATSAFSRFLKKVRPKAAEIGSIFSFSGLVLCAGKDGFCEKTNIDYKVNWFIPFMEKELKISTNSIVKNVYAIKKGELFSIGFVFLPKRTEMRQPLDDLLGSYAICYSMFLSALKKKSRIILKSSSPRVGPLDSPELTSELLTTLYGLELEKNIDTGVFRSYRELSKTLPAKNLRIPSANFFIDTKGESGRHYFGEKIGYPTQNRKAKWTSPKSLMCKFHWYPQSYFEDRPPASRLAFTQSVPIDKFIKATDIDYVRMRRENRRIGKKLAASACVIVKSAMPDGCDFKVVLAKKNGARNKVLFSDSDVRHLVNKEILKSTKKQFGSFGNIPGGEAFTTPQYLEGRIVGDVVIQIDRSYRLSKNCPVVAAADIDGYNIVSGPKEILEAFNKKREDAWKKIMSDEKNNVLSSEQIKIKKNNFNKIGEFAINTNPNAEICDYLIINEKIAGMIHVAFGSGFEKDAQTDYHMDVVIDAKRQELDIFGLTKDNKKILIMRKGILV